MVDEAEKIGLKIDQRKLSDELNIPVVLTAALTGRGIDDLKAVLDDYAGARKTELAELQTAG
jgi:ferrous iron transport protein B